MHWGREGVWIGAEAGGCDAPASAPTLHAFDVRNTRRQGSATLPHVHPSPAPRLLRPAAPTPGFWRLHIDCGGQPLPGTPFSVLAADPALAIAAGAAGAAGTCDAAAAKPAAVGDAQAAADDTAAVIATFQQPDGAASAAAAAAAPPIVRDQMAVWERIAAAAFAEPDGSMEGWDDDAARGPPKSSEDTYIEVRRCGRRHGKGAPLCARGCSHAPAPARHHQSPLPSPSPA